MKNNPIKKLADMAGISFPHLINIIEGRRRPSWPVGKRLADVCNSSIVVWMDGTPDEIKKAVNKKCGETAREIK